MDLNIPKVGILTAAVLHAAQSFSVHADQVPAPTPKYDRIVVSNGSVHTLTHALLEGSPAIDKAITGGCPSSEQRGSVRPFDALTLVAVGDASLCAVSWSAFSCTLPEILANETRSVAVTVTAAVAGSFDVTADVTGDVIDADSTDNATPVAGRRFHAGAPKEPFSGGALFASTAPPPMT